VVTRVTDLRTGQADYKALDDRMLVLDFQAGHPQAFVEIHRRYSGLARHVCHRFLPNANDADEALQETMIRVFQGLYRFNGRYALQPWIGRIATNVALDAIRTQTRRPQLDDESLDRFEREDPADGPAEAVERLIERDLVLSVLSRLPETHRTALVLRELEGRSHQEIAETMGMTPSQVKALIHRAKGSFRRRWLLAVTEKGGLTGIALLPLVWLLRAADVARRFADRAGHAAQTAQVATPEIVSSAASSPAISAAGSGIGERVVAAGVTLLVAGSVTVGAATISRNRGERVERAEAPVAVVAEPAPTVEPAAEVAHRRDENVVRQGQGERVKPVVDEPTPTVAPTPTPTVSPSVSPTPTPTPIPSPTPTPVLTEPPIPPAPPWSIGIQTWGAWSLSCDCARSFRLVSSEVKGQTGQQVFFVQEAAGEAVDAEGVPAWQLSAVYSGYAEGSQGRFSLFLDVETPEGEFRYEAWGVLEDVQPTASAGLEHTYDGRYRLVSFRPADGLSEAPEVLPSTGVLTAQVTWWADETSLTGVVLVLEER
jgi:RNA polymerase sigma-70 factor, ECF subfamily